MKELKKVNEGIEEVVVIKAVWCGVVEAFS